MLLRHTRLAAVTAALLVSLASTASAQIVLWDQSNWGIDGSLNLSSTSCSQISGNTKLHTASDVHFDAPVHITSVIIYETEGNVAAATQAYLWIAPKTSSIPTNSSSEVNNAANIVPITIGSETINGNFTRIVTAGNLNINLPAGDYWVSLTPRHSRGIFPYTVHRIAAGPIVGDPSRSIEACVVNSNWVQVLPYPTDYAFKIMGDFPVSTQNSTWGRVKSIYR